MKYKFLPICLLSAATAASAFTLKNNTDHLSYAMGLETGKAFKEHSVKINPAAFSHGVKDGFTGIKPLMNDTQVRQALTQFRNQSIQQQEAKLKMLSEENLKKSEAFLKENAKKTGVKTTDTGLQYKILTPGKGEKPNKNSTVTVDYEGKLTTGKVFDSSYKRGEPTSFGVGNVIPGWTEALQMMHAGATWELYIPPQLAYGRRGAPGIIGPNEALIFKVHLIKVINK